MTILVVHKQRNLIYVASDSRYSQNNLHTDSGPKIFKMQTKIYGANQQGLQPDEAPILYTGTIGLAFTGDVAFFTTLKARLEWVLEYIQIAQNKVDDSSELIREIVFTIYKNLIKETADLYDADVILLLNDSTTNLPKAYCMSPALNDKSGELNAVINEISDEYYFLGSEKETAESVYNILKGKNSLPRNVFQLAKKIISECSKKENSSVGGDLQAGRMNTHEFEVCGIQDFRENRTPGEFFKYTFGGMVLHDDKSLPPHINVKRSFLKIYNDEDIKQKLEEDFNLRYQK